MPSRRGQTFTCGIRGCSTLGGFGTAKAVPYEQKRCPATGVLRAGPRRPDDALISFRDGRETLVGELLHALAAVRLRRVDVPFRVGRHAVDAVELARLPPAVAEAREQLERVAQDHVDFVVLAVGEIQVLLLSVA